MWSVGDISGLIQEEGGNSPLPLQIFETMIDLTTNTNLY